MKINIIIIYIICSLNLNLYSQIQNDFYNINTIREIRITFKEHNWDAILDSLFQNVGENGRLHGDVTIDGHTIYNAGVRYKGYSSWDAVQVKSPFNIDLEYSVNNRNHKGYTKLKLSNVIRDPSFIREVLAYEIAREYMPASKANFANVYVNDTLIGLYTNVEAVDKNFTEEHYGSRNNSFFKGSPDPLIYPYGQNANLVYHGADSSVYASYYKLESDYGWNDIVNFINILNNDTANLESVLNIDRTLWMHAFNYSLLNIDSYIGYSQNYYMYKDNNGRFNPIIWDLNMSFGSFRNSDGTKINLSISEMKQLNPLAFLNSVSSLFSPRPLIKNILQNSTYRRMFLAHIRTIFNENFKNGKYYTRAQEIHNFIDTYVQEDPNKFYPYSYFTKNIDTTVGPTANQYPGIKDIMEARIDYLDTFPGIQGAPLITDIKHHPLIPENGLSFWITAKICRANNIILAYRYNSNDIFRKTLMFDDGNHNDGIAADSTFGVQLTLSGKTIQYYIYAENDSAGIFSPERAEYEYYTIQPKIQEGDIVINEFCDKWIEIFNNTNENFNLKKLYISGNSANITKWQFPDTTINSKSFLILLLKGIDSLQGIPTNIELSDKGDKIILSDSTTIIDSVIFGQQATGKTTGRYPNGIGSFTYMQPSFLKHNYVSTVSQPDFILFPNPATDKIYIETVNNSNPLLMNIFNTDGQIVISEQYSFNNENIVPVINIIVDISLLHKGVYYIKLICNDKIMIKKFIIC